MKKKKNRKKPRVNPELEGFDIKIDSFGEVKSNFDIDKLNEFLNRKVDDKKLRERDDLPSRKDTSDPEDGPEGKKKNKANNKR